MIDMLSHNLNFIKVVVNLLVGSMTKAYTIHKQTCLESLSICLLGWIISGLP